MTTLFSLLAPIRARRCHEPRSSECAALLYSRSTLQTDHMARMKTDPFAQSYPENYDSSVDFSALSARFNPHGRYAGQYIAVGRNDGVVAIYDFETKGLVRWFEGHVKAVTAVVCASSPFLSVPEQLTGRDSWSRFSKYLLTASKDWNVIVWDLSKRALESAQGERKLTVRFDAPVTSADLHPVSR